MAHTILLYVGELVLLFFFKVEGKNVKSKMSSFLPKFECSMKRNFMIVPTTWWRVGADFLGKEGATAIWRVNPSLNSPLH